MRGVLGHEISHVGNWDILIASVAAGLASMIMILVNLAQLGALFGSGGNDEDSGPGFLEIILGHCWSAGRGADPGRDQPLARVAADASGAQVTGDPLALAAALAKIE